MPTCRQALVLVILVVALSGCTLGNDAPLASEWADFSARERWDVTPELSISLLDPHLVQGGAQRLTFEVENRGGENVTLSFAERPLREEELLLAPASGVALPGTSRVAVWVKSRDPAQPPSFVRIEVGVGEESRVFTTFYEVTAPTPTLADAPVPDAEAPVVEEPAIEEPTDARAPWSPPAGAIAATGVSALAALIYLAFRTRDWWRFLLLAPLAGLFSRIAPSDVLGHATREELHRVIGENPGIHLAALQKLCGLSTGVLLHHTQTLERAKLIRAERDGPLRRFYLASHAPLPPAGGLTPMQTRVLELLLPARLTQREVAAALGLSQQAANHHVKALERRGLVRVQREGIRTFVERHDAASAGFM